MCAAKLLDMGNDVLIVTKPSWAVVPLICEAYSEHKEHILWRFTIGSADNKTLAFWEPSAPRFEERLSCLQYAYHRSFKTSVSCEPYLDPYIDHIYAATRQYITESFWIGMLRNFESRVELSDVADEDIKRFVTPLRNAQQKQVVKSIYEMMKDKPLVKFKDSVRKLLEIDK